jgi:transcription-repair coupling factor (superfamily II helicase)
MLKKAIKKLKAGEKVGDMFAASETYCDVNLNVTAILPIDYCPNIHERLIYYKRLAKAENTEQLDLVYQNIIDNYGLPPEAVRTLIALHQLRITACKFGIQKLDVSNATINLLFIDKPPVEPLQIVLLMQQLKTCKYDGKNKLIWQVKSANLAAKLYNAEFILNQLEQCVR